MHWWYIPIGFVVLPVIIHIRTRMRDPDDITSTMDIVLCYTIWWVAAAAFVAGHYI